MLDLIFVVIAYLLLLPVLILVPMKLSFKHKMMMSIGALFLTVLCVLANRVIPLYQVMIIFTLLLLLSTYFLETRLRPQFLHSLKTPEDQFKTQSKGVLEEEAVQLRTDTGSPLEVKEAEEKDGYIEEQPLYKNSLNINEEMIDVNVDQAVSEVQSTPLYEVEDEWEDIEKQLQEWEHSSKMDSIPDSSSILSAEEEEEYNRLFSETKN